MRYCRLLTWFLLNFLFLFIGNKIVFGAICIGSGTYSYTTSNCGWKITGYYCRSPAAAPQSANYTCSWNNGSCGYYKKDSCWCAAPGPLSCITGCYSGVDPYWSTSGCKVCTPVNGACGSANGGAFDTTPTTDLCLTGTASVVTLSGTTYTWTCTGSCTGSTATCSASNDAAPTFSSLTLKTYDGDVVAAETGSRNQICQSIFRQDTVNKNGVQFIVTATNPLGVGNIGTIQARLRNTTNTYTFNPVASVNGVATIPVDLNASGVATGTYNIEVLINDVGSTLNSGWIDTGRDFKNWDCKVAITGNFYDGSTGENCPNFSTNLATDINFSSLSFNSPSSGLSSNMSVNGSTYTSGSNPLIWGTSSYQAIFNSDLSASDKSLRLIDMGIGTTSCNSTLNFDLDSNIVDPYDTTPTLRADFSGMVSQNSWFQAIDGGVFGKSTITNFVPTTCGLSTNGCIEATSVGGLVAAPTINGFDNVNYSTPDNWYTNTNTVNQIDFFGKYKNITGVGTTLINGDLSDSNIINNDGLLIVDGDVNISQNKTTSVGNFSMIVASGNITIDPSVTRFDGILAGNNIDIGGSSATQLTINGSLYGTNQVNITRSYVDKIDNNDSPAVEIQYRPDFIFNMPTSMAKNVVEWKWGN